MKLTGKTSPALQEIHIFLDPINPDQETVDKFVSLCELYNKKYSPPKPMKACHLALEFRTQGTVCVMQSSRYLPHDDTEYVIEQTHFDAKFFTEHGFKVIREKIEASIHGINEIPRTEAPADKTYFEFHIRIEKPGADKLSQEELDELLELSKKFTIANKIPVPLSYNKCKNPEGEYQRYFNARFRNVGSTVALEKINQIRNQIEATNKFRCVKTISEYVWFDTFTALDFGWIDFDPTEELTFE